MSGVRVARRRGLGAVVVAAIALLAITGCTGIPDGGTVHAQTASAAPENIDVILLPPGPVPDANQSQILNGFLQAAASPQNDYAVARSFLSKGFAKQWDPNAGVLVDSGQPTLTPDPDSETAMTVSITPQAEVDGTGEYVENASTAAVTVPFQFTQEDGQWRINLANPGIILEQTRFAQVFSPHSLYFYDPTYTYLVPDVRWFPKDETTGTRVVKSLLAGPTAWLGQGAVVTAFPEGTETSSVVILSGTASVDLSSQVLTQSPVVQQRMQYQLDTSLGSVSSVAAVAITVNQSPLTIPSGAAPVLAPRVDSKALVEQSGAFGYLSSSALVPIPGVSDKVQGLAPLSVTSSANVLAVGTATGVYVVQPGDNPPVLVDGRQGLLAPTLDPSGYVWTVPAATPDAVQAYGSDGTVHPVAVSWDTASTIVSFDVSRDGTRALAFTVTDGVPKLAVAAIIRDKDGGPERLGDPVTLASGPGTPLDATWVDPSNVASLTVTAGGDDRVVLQEIGGMSTALGSPTDATTLAGSNDVTGLWLLTSKGELQQQRGSGWQTTAKAVTLLATQS